MDVDGTYRTEVFMRYIKTPQIRIGTIRRPMLQGCDWKRWRVIETNCNKLNQALLGPRVGDAYGALKALRCSCKGNLRGFIIMFFEKRWIYHHMLLSGNGDQPWRISDLQALLSLYRIARLLEVTR